MDELRKIYNDLYSQPAPKGFAASAEDLDVFVYQYSSWIMGYASSYLDGEKIDLSRIELDKELDQKLEKCLLKLNELIAWKQKHDIIAQYLIRELSSD